ncbi:MAG: hypothetical protein ABI968_11025 [Acidobacteriota bacterium]
MLIGEAPPVPPRFSAGVNICVSAGVCEIGLSARRAVTFFSFDTGFIQAKLNPNIERLPP